MRRGGLFKGTTRETRHVNKGNCWSINESYNGQLFEGTRIYYGRKACVKRSRVYVTECSTKVLKNTIVNVTKRKGGPAGRPEKKRVSDRNGNGQHIISLSAKQLVGV